MTAQENSTESNTASSKRGRQFWRAIDPQGRYAKAGFYLLVLSETLAWYTGREYQGHTLKRTDTEWLLILRATFNGKPEVAFVVGADPYDAIRALALEVRHGAIRFKPDRYG